MRYFRNSFLNWRPIVDLDECSNVVSISPIMIGEIDDVESDDPKTGAHSS